MCEDCATCNPGQVTAVSGASATCLATATFQGKCVDSTSCAVGSYMKLENTSVSSCVLCKSQPSGPEIPAGFQFLQLRKCPGTTGYDTAVYVPTPAVLQKFPIDTACVSTALNNLYLDQKLVSHWSTTLGTNVLLYVHPYSSPFVLLSPALIRVYDQFPEYPTPTNLLFSATLPSTASFTSGAFSPDGAYFFAVNQSLGVTVLDFLRLDDLLNHVWMPPVSSVAMPSPSVVLQSPPMCEAVPVGAWNVTRTIMYCAVDIAGSSTLLQLKGSFVAGKWSFSWVNTLVYKNGTRTLGLVYDWGKNNVVWSYYTDATKTATNAWVVRLSSLSNIRGVGQSQTDYDTNSLPNPVFQGGSSGSILGAIIRPDSTDTMFYWDVSSGGKMKSLTGYLTSTLVLNAPPASLTVHPQIYSTMREDYSYYTYINGLLWRWSQCTQCPANMVFDSSLTSGVRCKCGPGFYTKDSVITASTTCIAHTECLPGQYLSVAGTPTQNAVCSTCNPCAAGKYQDASVLTSCSYLNKVANALKDPSCKSCATCPATTNGLPQYAPGQCLGNSTVDLVVSGCKPCPTCLNGQYLQASCPMFGANAGVISCVQCNGCTANWSWISGNKCTGTDVGPVVPGDCTLCCPAGMIPSQPQWCDGLQRLDTLQPRGYPISLCAAAPTPAPTPAPTTPAPTPAPTTTTPAPTTTTPAPTTPAPTTPAPTPMPTPQCLDRTLSDGITPWTDSETGGNACDWYALYQADFDYCNSYGASYGGMTAKVACCACGGGSTGASTPAPTPAPTVSSTPAPTPAPTVSSTPAPTPAPTVSSTPAPTPAPTVSSTPAPTPAPTVSSTPAPTPAPTVSSTPAPTPGPASTTPAPGPVSTVTTTTVKKTVTTTTATRVVTTTPPPSTTPVPGTIVQFQLNATVTLNGYNTTTFNQTLVNKFVSAVGKLAVNAQQVSVVSIKDVASVVATRRRSRRLLQQQQQQGVEIMFLCLFSNQSLADAAAASLSQQALNAQLGVVGLSPVVFVVMPTVTIVQIPAPPPAATDQTIIVIAAGVASAVILVTCCCTAAAVWYLYGKGALPKQQQQQHVSAVDHQQEREKKQEVRQPLVVPSSFGMFNNLDIDLLARRRIDVPPAGLKLPVASHVVQSGRTTVGVGGSNRFPRAFI